ncbi:MAG: hypothetical protein LM523_03270 [Candidatus Contendobacter sp.]|nr:hypothetical protein [Candidatus Contendobacter sp.]
MNDPVPAIPDEFLRTGLLSRQAGQLVDQPFICRFLDARALPAVRRIHHEGLRRIVEPGLIREETDEFFRFHLQGEGRILGVFVAEQLVAYAVLALPDSAAYPYDRLVDELGLPASAWRRIGHLTGVGVLPEWWGNNLHLQLCQWRLGLARADGRRHAAAFAAPRNPFSWRNLLAAGLRIKGIRMMGGDKLRYLLHIDYHDAPPPDPDTAVIISVSAIADQRALLGQGYWGYAQAAPDSNGGRQLWYACPLHS